jgi:8-oxo-dGTP pyrophosphatase MutT (NUDIX family)
VSEPLWQSPELPSLLAEDFAMAANPRWRNQLAPDLSYGRHGGPSRRDSRAAAVAVVLCAGSDGWSVPLTVRHSGLTRHGGQVSFPGGLIDAGESPREAAARELREELGRHPTLQWLGELERLSVFASNAMVTPCVAAIDHWPTWTPQPAEVDQVLRLELRELMTPLDAPYLEIHRGPFSFMAPQVLVEGHSAWGATAVMLGELRGRLLRISDNIA